jgi:hypothetical protein
MKMKNKDFMKMFCDCESLNIYPVNKAIMELHKAPIKGKKPGYLKMAMADDDIDGLMMCGRRKEDGKVAFLLIASQEDFEKIKEKKRAIDNECR